MQVAELALAQVQVKFAKGEYLRIHEEKQLTFRQFTPQSTSPTLAEVP
jgi:hypothetical protein